MARLHGSAATAALMERARALPVTLQVAESDAFDRLVLGALRRR
jgi:hypothetical protein